jgi:hypothetical protein
MEVKPVLRGCLVLKDRERQEKRKMCHVTINMNSTGDCGLGFFEKGETRLVRSSVKHSARRKVLWLTLKGFNRIVR